jgi:hypothetical protein
MAVNFSHYELKPGRWRLRCRVTGQRDTYRFLPPGSTHAPRAAGGRG